MAEKAETLKTSQLDTLASPAPEANGMKELYGIARFAGPPTTLRPPNPPHHPRISSFALRLSALPAACRPR